MNKQKKLNKNPKFTIRVLVILPISIALLIFMGIFAYTFYSNTLNIVLESEYENMQLQGETITEIITTSTASIPAITRDWSSRDETYAFTLGENPSFVEDKLEGYSPLRQHKLNFAVIKDLSGKDLYSKFYDFYKDEDNPIPEGFTDLLSPLAVEMLKSYDVKTGYGYIEKIGKDGFMLFNGAAYYVCALPILNDNEDATPVGTLFFGRIFDESEIKRITHTSRMEFTIIDSKAPEIQGHDNTNSSTVIYKPLSGFDHVSGIALKIQNPRDFYKKGIEDIKVTATVLLVIMLLFIFVLFYLLERNILRPLGRLSSDIGSVTDESASINTGRYCGSLEFFTLSNSINDMLKKLAQSRHFEASVNALKSVLNGIDAYIYVSDINTDEILFINDRMVEHFGLGDNAVGKTCWQVLQSGFEQRCEFCPNIKLLEDPDSSVIWEEHNTVTGHYYNNTDRIIEWYDGKKVHMQHSMDVTEIKQTQAALTRRLMQQELMSSISQSFITDYDINVYINNALQMTGEFMNVSRIILSRYDEDQGVLEPKYAWRNSKTQTSVDMSRKVRFAEGAPLYEELVENNSPIVYVNDMSVDNKFKGVKPPDVKAFLSIPVFVSGDFWGTLGLYQCQKAYEWSESDIHLGKLIRNVLSGVITRQIMEDDKKRAEEDILRAKEMAEQANKAKSEFLSRMSHEMRTPMNAIIGMTNIAKNTNDLPKKQHCLERIDNASKHLLGVINDILDMSKIEANKFDLYIQEFDFEKMLIDVTNVINFRTEEKRQNLIVNLNRDVPLSLVGDELRLTQVLTNLLTNAVKFTPEGGTVVLSVEKIAESDGIITLKMEVVDNGIGISPEQQSRLFTSFEQADGGISRKFGGTGLGLAISKRIIELMGGKIWIESELGKGSKFIFTVNVGRGEAKLQHKLYTGINKDEVRILVVDDSPETRDYFLHVMDALGLPCDVASDGYEALNLLNNCGDKPYNIFFVDWQMPNMNGIELTRKIKEFINDKAVIIMVSVAEWDDLEPEATAAGVNRFIPKPLFPSAIIDSINQCLGQTRHIEAAAQKQSFQGKFDFKNHSLLLAEDVDVNREIMENILEDTGADIDFAENGLEAVNMFKENPGKYSLILMDIQMPEMNGYEAAREIRSLDYAEAKNIPIIAMTANVFREDIENCLAAGMNDHVGKPIDTNDLFSKLSLHLKPKIVIESAKKATEPAKSENTKTSSPDDYSEFMPTIDIPNALNRLMNNKKLYLTLLRNFTDKQISDELVKNINDGDLTKTIHSAHALKGMSANLGLKNLLGVVTNIEIQAKEGIDSKQMVTALNDAVNEAVTSINILLKKEGMN